MATANADIENIRGLSFPEHAEVIIVKTAWNSHVTNLLEQGCVEVLQAAGVSHSSITVPGAIEIGFAIQRLHNKSGSAARAYIALGCVIRGGTPHFDYVCNSVTQAITTLNLQLNAPVVFGILTVNDQMQADERCGGREGHKGREAAATALKMIAFNHSLR